MENYKRITLSLALIAIIAVAAIGIGYAYTAITTNEGNSATLEYITISQDGDGAYQFTNDNNVVYWDSEDKKVAGPDNEGLYHTVYKLADNTATINGEGTTASQVQYTVVCVGKPIILHTAQNSTSTAKVAGVTCDLPTDSTVFVKPADVNGVEVAVFLQITVGSANPVYYKLTADNVFNALKQDGNNYAWNGGHEFNIPADSGANYEDVTVKVLYGYTGTDGITYKRLSPDAEVSGPSTNPFTGSKLVFKINETGSNTDLS